MPAFFFSLCADDYALTAGVSRGIVEALDAGRLTATSAMTNMPGWPEASRNLAGLQGRAEIGVHINFTQGAPLAPMPSLAPQGQFPRIGALVCTALLRRLPEFEVRAEISRQLDAFEAAMGRPPDFVDGHQHVQVLPGVRRWLIEAMQRRGWAGKVWLRDSADKPWAIAMRRVEAVKALQVAALAAGFARLAGAAGFRTNCGFAGFSAFDPKRDYAADFATYLKNAGPRHLVMCHPGHVDAASSSLDDVTATREIELAFLLSPEFPLLLNRAGARLRLRGAEN